MDRYEYDVLKPFKLKRKDGKTLIIEPGGTEKVKGTSKFRKGANYVDYIAPEEDIIHNPVTQELVDKGFIQYREQKDFSNED